LVLHVDLAAFWCLYEDVNLAIPHDSEGSFALSLSENAGETTMHITSELPAHAQTQANTVEVWNIVAHETSFCVA
jgi:hypothetical protein